MMLFRTFALFVILITDQNGSLATTPMSDDDEAFEEGLCHVELLILHRRPVHLQQWKLYGYGKKVMISVPFCKVAYISSALLLLCY